MEIYVKKHEGLKKLNWLSSIPSRYKNEILAQILDSNIELDNQNSYKIIIDLLGEHQRRWNLKAKSTTTANPSATHSPIKSLSPKKFSSPQFKFPGQQKED